MTIDVFTRHSADCPHKDDRYWKRCRCRKWLYIEGSRKPVAARTRSWEEAQRKARDLEQRFQQAGGKPASVGFEPVPEKVSEAVKKFLENKQQEGMSKAWNRMLTRELTDLGEWCGTKLVNMVTLNKLALEEYRKTWTQGAGTRARRQERLSHFFKYCVEHGWVRENFAARLGKIKVAVVPTLPLTREQFAAVLYVATRYNPKSPDATWRQQRAVAMLLLLRWSGLRISDAAKLACDRLQANGSLYLYTQKTGVPVYVKLPPYVVKMLRELHKENPRYFFWNGTSDAETPGKAWWKTLKKIFKAAGIPDARPHMLRDTFAVETLLAGATIEEVSVLLGHSSVKITQKHYLAWVKERQEKLDRAVEQAWGNVPVELVNPAALMVPPSTRLQ